MAVLGIFEMFSHVDYTCGSTMWIANSGATFHIEYDRKMFTILDEKKSEELITLVDNCQVMSKSIGSIRVKA